MILTVLITIVAFFGVLALLIIAHELGHYITAKASRIKVEEFGLGFPPRLLARKWGETEYSLNAIPLGGFVKMAGEEDPTISRSLASKPIGIRLLVLSAGSLMNFLLPLLLLSMALMIPHNVITSQVVVEEVAENSPAASAGIEVGDVLLSVNDKPVHSIADLQRYTHLNLGNEVTLVVEHSDLSTESVQVVPRWKPPPDEGAIGTLVTMVEPTVVSESLPFWQAIPAGVVNCVEIFILFKNEIMMWFIGASSPQITGPVGIAQLTGEFAKAGISPLLEFAAFLSINLGIVNLFPLPALDGGRIVFVLLEWVRRGKRISARTEGLVHLIGFAMLITAMVLVTYQDLIRIISGDSLLP